MHANEINETIDNEISRPLNKRNILRRYQYSHKVRYILFERIFICASEVEGNKLNA